MLRDRRTAAVAAAVALLLVGVGLWRWQRAVPRVPAAADDRAAGPRAIRSDARGGPTPAAASTLPAPGTRGRALAATPATTAAPEATAGAEEPLADQPQIVALARQAADAYRAGAQYPPWSHPFNEEGEDPILRDRLVSPVIAAGPDGEEPTLVVFPDQLSFEAPDPVLLYAYLSVNDTRVPAGAISGAITSEDLQPLAALTYHDDGSDGDRVAGDYVYTARFEPGPDFAPELSESFLVRVVAETSDGAQRIAATSFLYSRPHAHLTGAFRDAIVDGSLVIDAEVEVDRPGRFHLEGTLYREDGQQGIGEAHAAAELGPGRQWMRLTFFGRIINQSQIDGPYLLRFAALSTTTAMPNAKNRLVVNAHRTGAYRFTQFSAAPFDDPDLLDAAGRLEGDLQGR